MIETIDNDFRRQICPFCESTRIGLLGEIPVPWHIGFSTHEIAPSRKSELWQCADCRSWFKQNVLRPEQAVALYRSGESGNRWASANIEQIKCGEVLETLRACAKPSSNALDIGSSTGQLLDFLRAGGCDTAGVEYSSACRAILESKGHRYFPAIDQVEGRFDLITAFDLVEHLYDIPGFFRRCRELLVEGGTLVLLTGDIESLSARLCRGKWWYLRYPEHVVFPSTRFLGFGTGHFVLRKKVRTYAAKGYREPWYRVARKAGPALVRGRYDGLPALGPDHALMVLGRE